MTVKLLVNWKEKEILTTKQLDEKIDARVEEVMQDTDAYNEYLDDYLGNIYLKKKLFDALSGSDADREEVLNDIRSAVARAIYDFVDMDISTDYAEVTIEV